MGNAAVHARLLRAQTRAQVQYRLSFAFDTAGSAVWAVLDVTAVLVYFHVNRSLGGFSLRQGFLMASLGSIGWALADLVTGNVDRLPFQIRTGRLDTLLVRPLGLLSQLVSMDFAPRRAGRVVQAVIGYGIGLSYARITWTPARAVLAGLAPVSAAVFFGALFVVGASVAFWWIDSTEVANGVTAGGSEFSRYPVTVYNGLLRWLFGYGIGFAFVIYHPALVLLGRPDPLGGPAWFGWCAPPVAGLAALVAAAIWRTGVRHYRSTGS